MKEAATTRRLRLVKHETSLSSDAVAVTADAAHVSDVRALGGSGQVAETGESAREPFVATGLARPKSLCALADADLVTLGLHGSTVALEVLYRRHVAFAINLAARVEGSARDVEDVAHDAFVRAFEHLGELADSGAFRSWLGSIVVRIVRSRMRRAKFLRLFGFGVGESMMDIDAVVGPVTSPAVRAQLAQIYALLCTLPTDDRIAWTLRAVEEHDLDTVAQLTHCSLATVKRRIARAQRFLDQHFVDPARQEVSS